MHSLKYDPYGRNRIQILIMYFCSMYENCIYLFRILQGLPETCEYLKVVRIMEIFQSCICKWVVLHLFKLEAVDCLGGWRRTFEAMLRSITFAPKEPKARQLTGTVSFIWLPLSPHMPLFLSGYFLSLCPSPLFPFQTFLPNAQCLWENSKFASVYGLGDTSLSLTTS